ncbi:hypothetical protein LCGC14_0422920 [marine sediment metagenome]|uniref:Uncharacterized protein n=1 Tax=marine sediment metagenome TaxID=412755 RepID=A0A0F9SWG9_9ZZZZ
MKRTCTKCKKTKSLSEFYKDNHLKSKLSSCCKVCLKEKSRKYKQTHKIEHAKYMKKYRKTFMGYLRQRFHEMKKRCTNPNYKQYKNYGGRGIKCLFKNANEFIDYIINELQVNPHGLQIDRINNDGNYEPGNIRFVTHDENCRNR